MTAPLGAVCVRVLQAALPGFTFTPMREGIKKSVDWFFDNYETARK